ncbi:hypothetical protein [Piscinibacter sp. HJYY11]|uniref:hypothetical protein n=1 Tax=Piscinibacter sp. HJYY11 TaxID=2801333 RepID=UPI00191D38A2|nr:hypothetical protein [Piscinibacter sp. HJYY11]MBL0730800.1 hypothetical protein [Piscinibacter sp. HJYY11]
MKNAMTHLLIPAAIAALALTTHPVRAQDDAASPPPGASARSVLPGEAVPLPEVQTSGNVSYVSGGIPYEQLPAFHAARSQFPLNIEVYERDGNRNAFTAEADVRVINVKTGDVVLETKTEGPYLWAKVPPGQYKVETTLNGKVKEARVAVSGSKTARTIVVFPDGTTE